jgi:hypothetical protein
LSNCRVNSSSGAGENDRGCNVAFMRYPPGGLVDGNIIIREKFTRKTQIKDSTQRDFTTELS